MLRALLWKEWREQRALLLAGLGLVAALPVLTSVTILALMSAVGSRRIGEAVSLILVFFLWPLFVLAAGTGAFASESAGSTLGFLLSRPVTRRWIWLTKVAISGFVVVLVIGASLGFLEALEWLAGGPPRAESAVASLQRSLSAPEQAVFGPLLLYLLFASAAFFAVRRRRALVAAAGAVVVSALVSAAIVTAWPLMGLEESFVEIWVGGEIGLAATLLLALSSRRLSVARPSAGVETARTTASLLGAITVTALAGFMPVVWADGLAGLDRAVVYDTVMAPRGEALIVGAAVYPSPLGSLWRLDPPSPRGGSTETNDGDIARHPGDSRDSPGNGPGDAAATRLTRRLAFRPFLSADGSWVYYFTIRRFPGLVSDTVDLRAVRVDGSENRLVVGDVGRLPENPSWPGLRHGDPGLLSPDGRRMVLADGWNDVPMLIDLEAGAIDLLGAEELLGDEPPDWYLARPLAWLSTDVLLFQVSTYRRDQGSARVVVRHPIDSADPTALIRFEDLGGGAYPPLAHSGARPALHRVPVYLYRLDDYDEAGEPVYGSGKIHLLDGDTGELLEVEHLRCGTPGLSVSADGSVLAYATYRACREDDHGFLEGVGPVLNIREVETGNVRRLDPGAEELDWISVSTGGERVSARASGGDGRERFLIVDPAGSHREIDVRRFVDGVLRGPYDKAVWLDDRRFLLRYGAEHTDGVSASLVVMDSVDGAAVHVYRLRRVSWRPF